MMGIDAEMFVRTMATIAQEFVDKLSYDLGCAFGHERFWIWDEEHGNGSTARKAAMLVDHVDQDACSPDDELKPRVGETFIQVNPATRYYGHGYERGDLPFLISLAEFLEQRLPGGSVWYGGDSSGMLFEPFGVHQRTELFEHFCRVGHAPYVKAFNHFEGDRPVCTFCGGAPMTLYSKGPGASLVSWICRGCGARCDQIGEQWNIVKRPGDMNVKQETG